MLNEKINLNERYVLCGFVAAYALVVLQNAWLHEDAFITYRTVDNLLNGYGAVWNVGERVQTYTHPLWFFCMALAHALSGEVYYTSLFISWLCSVGAVALMALALASTARGAVVGIVLFCMCKAFVDYSSSGLENPLSHVLLVLFLIVLFRPALHLRGLVLLAALAALAALNRMDALLVYLPGLVWYSAQLRSEGWLRIVAAWAIGFAPFVLWEFFSLAYYGFLVPNTAYGKLNTGIASADLARQGMYYLLHSLRVDPLALALCGVAFVCCAYRRQGRECAVALGCFFYLLYVVKIGGDYMAGRFVALPFLAASCLVVRVFSFADIRIWSGVLALVVIVGILAPSPPVLSGANYEHSGLEAERGILDERANYHAATGLLKAWAAADTLSYPRHEWVDVGRELKAAATNETRVITTYYNLGILPFYAGSKFHHIDVLGITDPLLARLPAYANNNWSPGHFERILPEGYLETLLYGANVISDRKLGLLHDKLTLITQGPIWTLERWQAIWAYHTGQYGALVDYDAYRLVSEQAVRASHARALPRVRIEPRPFARYVALGDIYFASRVFVLASRAYAEAIAVLDEEQQSGEELRHAYLHWALSLYALGDEEGAIRSLRGFAAGDFSEIETRTMLEGALRQILGRADSQQ